MTRAEAIAIAGARPAQAMFDAGPAAIDPAVLASIIVRKEAAASWLSRRRGAASWACLVWALLAGIAIVALGLWMQGAALDPRRWGEGVSKEAIGNSLGAGFFAAMGVGFACLWRACSRFPADYIPDLRLAQALLAAMEREEPGLKRLQARARSGAPFILYLRTFRTETAAQTKYEAHVQVVADNPAAFLPEGIASPAFTARQNSMAEEALVATVHAEWDLHLAVIRSLARRAPVLCLGNLRLSETKQDELKALGVDQVILVKADWWPVLVELADRAANIVVFVSAETDSVDRELVHLAAGARPFVLVSTREVHARMSASPAYTQALASPAARHVLLEGEDAAPLEAMLDSPG